MQKILSKNKLTSFLESLMKNNQVIAPVREADGKASCFNIIAKQDIKNLYLDKLTEVPFKQFLIPENEILLKSTKGKLIERSDSKNKKNIVFGLRKCDLNAIKILDKIMHDSYYIKKRKNTILLGLYCTNPDDSCFCNSMELEGVENCCDLFFYESNNNYYISVFTKAGENLVKNLPEAKREVLLNIKNKKQLPNKEIENEYQNNAWEKDSNKCLSCAACTSYCPTCNCFDLKDNLDINLKDGERIRKQSSCQLKSFSRVAGGKVFRDSRLSRFKHFVYHKISYFKKSTGRYMCVGCGRCLRVCPTKIDWVETINSIKRGK